MRQTVALQEVSKLDAACDTFREAWRDLRKAESELVTLFNKLHAKDASIELLTEKRYFPNRLVVGNTFRDLR